MLCSDGPSFLERDRDAPANGDIPEEEETKEEGEVKESNGAEQEGEDEELQSNKGPEETKVE